MVPDGELAGEHDDLPQSSFTPSPHPNLLIGESAARQLLAEANLDLDELVSRSASGEEMAIATDLSVRLEVGLAYEERLAVNVIGYFPAADIQTEGDRILVAAAYTGMLPRAGVAYPGADENGSGVALMLEVARLWRDVGFEPKRTVVFAALDWQGGQQFVNFPPFPTSAEDNWTVVAIDGLAAGGSRLARQEEGQILSPAFDESARRFRLRTEPFEDWRFFFINYLCTPDEPCWTQEAYSGIAVTRLGDDLSGTPSDTLDHLDPGLLAEAGPVIAHYLMVLANR